MPNGHPMAGRVLAARYHPGKYLVAWHPKSSTENERTTHVIEGQHGTVLFRQIAGAVARRICWYLKEGDQLTHGDEVGFIKFGSRIDVFLPLDSEICVAMDQDVSEAERRFLHDSRRLDKRRCLKLIGFFRFLSVIVDSKSTHMKHFTLAFYRPICFSGMAQSSATSGSGLLQGMFRN
jgi:hypothetical protein